GPDREAISAVTEWMLLVGLRGAGESVEGAPLVRAHEAELHFAVLPAPAAPLRVVVDWDRGQNCFFRVGPYAVSYVASKGAVSPDELQFLERLRATSERAISETSDIRDSE